MPHDADTAGGARRTVLQRPQRHRVGTRARRDMPRHESTRGSLDIDDSARAFRAPKTAELVARELRNQIVRGELPEDATLPAEIDLMARFNVSRPTLREALRILESESLITVTRGSRDGPRINLPSPRVAARHFGVVLQSRGTTLEDMFQVRVVVEPVIARELAEHASPKRSSALRASLEEQRLAAGDPAAFSRAGARFHKILIEQTGNRVLVLFMAMVNHIFETRLPTPALSAAISRTDASAPAAALAANEKLVKLIEQGRAGEAERFWRSHLEKQGRIMRRSRVLRAGIDMLDRRG